MMAQSVFWDSVHGVRTELQNVHLKNISVIIVQFTKKKKKRSF